MQGTEMENERVNTEISFLRHLVSIPSVTGNEKQIAEFLEDEMRKIGMEVVFGSAGENQPVVLGILRGAKDGPVLVFNGHMDTHPVENYQGNPYLAEIKDKKLFGRGSVDMKGGLAAMMCSARRIADQGGLKKGTLILAAVPDEEMLSRGTSRMVCMLEEMGIQADGGIVGEPTKLKVGSFMRGVTHIDITVTGYPKHTSGENHTGNAIVQMGRVLAALEGELTEKYQKRRHPILGSPIFNVGLIQGGEKPNVAAKQCCVTLLRRDMPGEDSSQVMKEIEELAKAVIDETCQVKVCESKIQKRPGKKRLPMEVGKEERIVRMLLGAAKDVTGENQDVDMVPFWCDASIMSNEGRIPTVVFGPGDIACAHSPKEWVDLDQYEKAVAIYEKTAVRFLHGCQEVK